MLIAFFDVKGNVHCKFLPLGQMINQHVYKKILRRLICSMHEKKRDLWQNKWVLHHDNAPVHTALSIGEFLAQKNITVLEQPPYFPYLAICGFIFFSKIKWVIKATCFEDVHSIKQVVTAELWRIPKESFQVGMQAWQRRIGKSIRLQEGNFEGDNL